MPQVMMRSAYRPGTNIPLLRLVDSTGLSQDSMKRITREVANLRNPLSMGTEVHRGYEEAFRTSLLKLGIAADYEPFSFAVGKMFGREVTYTPDFVTDVNFNGRQVILEPHAMRWHKLEDKTAEMLKFSLFKSKFGGRFYLILASDMSEVELGMRFSTNLSTHMDEYWELPEGISPNLEKVVDRHLEGLLARVRR